MYPNLKAEMARLGLSYADFAAAAGQSVSWVDNRLSETGRAEHLINELIKGAKETGSTAAPKQYTQFSLWRGCYLCSWAPNPQLKEMVACRKVRKKAVEDAASNC